MHVGGLSVEHWINDALMAIFFLLIGLELERELYIGELSDFKTALLPVFAAAAILARVTVGCGALPLLSRLVASVTNSSIRIFAEMRQVWLGE